jgi:AcrR family transcriptional regulator
MNKGDQEARDRIIKVTAEILDETPDTDKITVRQIAERAGVGVGLINYHFKTKDNLLSIVVGDLMAKAAAGLVSSESFAGLEPKDKIKRMLKNLYRFAEHYERLIRFLLTHSILNGDMAAPMYLVPLLREFFQSRKDEVELRIIALQVLLPIQATSLNPSTFRLYSGMDLHDEAQREKFIDMLVDNLVG